MIGKNRREIGGKWKVKGKMPALAAPPPYFKGILKVF
jgi:hypothetical protein